MVNIHTYLEHLFGSTHTEILGHNGFAIVPARVGEPKDRVEYWRVEEGRFELGCIRHF